MSHNTPDQDTAKGAQETEDHGTPATLAWRNSWAIATRTRC
jgi:hypothetical protein